MRCRLAIQIRRCCLYSVALEAISCDERGDEDVVIRSGIRTSLIYLGRSSIGYRFAVVGIEQRRFMSNKYLGSIRLVGYHISEPIIA